MGQDFIGIVSFNMHINPYGTLLSSVSTDEETEAYGSYVTCLKCRTIRSTVK